MGRSGGARVLVYIRGMQVVENENEVRGTEGGGVYIGFEHARD